MLKSANNVASQKLVKEFKKDSRSLDQSHNSFLWELIAFRVNFYFPWTQLVLLLEKLLWNRCLSTGLQPLKHFTNQHTTPTFPSLPFRYCCITTKSPRNLNFWNPIFHISQKIQLFFIWIKLSQNIIYIPQFINDYTTNSACETSLIRDKTVTDRFHFVIDFDTMCHWKFIMYELLANIMPIYPR